MIDKKFKSSKKQAQISEYVIETYNQKKDRSILEKKWNRYYDLYRGLNTKGSYNGRADLDWALAFLVVEILVPRIYGTLFPRSRWFDVVGVEQTDEKQASIMAAYMKQKLEKDIHFRRKMIPIIRSCCISGTMIGKTPYRREEKTVPVRKLVRDKGFFGLGGGERTEFQDEKIITFDSIDLEPVDIFDFFPADDLIDNIEDQPYVIHRTQEYYETLFKKEFNLESGAGQYENLDKIDIDKIKGNVGEEDAYKQFRKAMLGYKSREYDQTLSSIDFIEYQGVYEDEDVIFIVANDGCENPVVSAEVLNTPDKEKTFVMGKWIDIAGEFWGMSVLERVDRSLYELNDRVNQTMDTTSLIINPMWLNTDADIHEGTLRIFPGRIISTSTERGLAPLHPPVEILAPAYTAIQALIESVRDVTGATRFLGGSAQTPELQRTATGIISIIKEANARLNLVIQGLEDQWIIPFLRRQYKYAQFYAERKDVVRIVGKSGIEYQQVDPKTIIGDMDFRPVGSQSLGSEEIMTQQMINYLNIISRIPGVMQQFDVLKLASKIGEKMLGLEDLDELILVNNREQEETEKAISENQAAMEGVPPVISSTENHRLHIEIHQGLMLDPRAAEFPRAAELLNQHIKDHEKFENGQGMQPMYTPGNAGSPPESEGQDTRPSLQPQGTDMQSIVQQIAQPSQEGSIGNAAG